MIRKENGYDYGDHVYVSPLKHIRALEELRCKCMVELLAAHKDNKFTSGLALPKNRLQLQRGPVNLAAKFPHTDNYQSAVLAHHGLVAQRDGGGIGCRINLYPPHGPEGASYKLVFTDVRGRTDDMEETYTTMHETGDGPVLATWLYATTRLHGVVKEVGDASTYHHSMHMDSAPPDPLHHIDVPTAAGLRTEAGYVIVLHAGSDGSRISISGNASVGKDGIGRTGKDTLLAFLESRNSETAAR